MLRNTSLLALMSLSFGNGARAHTGHLGELAGHDHWVAGAAIGLAIALGVWGVLKGGKAPETEPEEEPTEDAGDEATA